MGTQATKYARCCSGEIDSVLATRHHKHFRRKGECHEALCLCSISTVYCSALVYIHANALRSLKLDFRTLFLLPVTNVFVECAVSIVTFLLDRSTKFQ